jgi:hypothetical protein
VYTGFWGRILEARGQMEDLGVDGRIILKRDLKKYDERMWAGLI